MDHAPLLFAVLATLLGIGLVFVLACMRRQTGALRAALRERDRAVAAEQGAIRMLRLAAMELRLPAMTLLGHADRLSRAGPAIADDDLAIRSAAIAGVTMQVLNLADELQDHAVGEPAARVLRPETVALEPMLRDAIAATDATLGPSRRHWRLAPGPPDTALLADRRALAQILIRVLGNAARLSRHEDWIDIRVTREDEGVAILIEDEGAGLPACQDAAAVAAAHPASRGLGLGLVLARTLMAAHGGALTVESASRVGSRVVLTFPLHSLVADRAFT